MASSLWVLLLVLPVLRSLGKPQLARWPVTETAQALDLLELGMQSQRVPAGELSRIHEPRKSKSLLGRALPASLAAPSCFSRIAGPLVVTNEGPLEQVLHEARTLLPCPLYRRSGSQLWNTR
jgi:hypothetical protein